MAVGTGGNGVRRNRDLYAGFVLFATGEIVFSGVLGQSSGRDSCVVLSGQALGSNLLGALVGGMLESVSLWTGIRSLIIIAGVLYLLSLLFLRSPKTAESRVPALQTS